MAENNFNACIAVVLPLEGPFVDDPIDPGGATAWGVTQSTWQHWVGSSKVVTSADIKGLTQSDVIPLYQKVFWEGCHCDFLPLGVDLAIFDWCINSGPGNGVRGLQRVLGVTIDGLCGPQTLKAAAAVPADKLITKISAARLIFDETETNPKEEAQDIKGWTNRINKIQAEAQKMAASAGPAA